MRPDFAKKTLLLASFSYEVVRFTRTDRSRSSLRRALLGGRIIFNNNSSIFDCVIREMSESRAVLELGSTFALPQVFVLETKPFKRRYDCNVDRRTPSTVEVSFLPPAI